MRFPKFELFSVRNAVCVDTGGKQRSLSTRFEAIYFGLFHENVLRRIRFVYVRYHIFYMCVKLYLLIIE